MDWPYVHRLINHFPIILTVVGTASVVAAFIWNRRALWLYGLATLTLAGLSVYPVFFTGDEAHHVMERRWYVVRSMVEAHEEAGELTLWVVLFAGAVSAYAWWRLLRRDTAGSLPRWLRTLVVVAALAGLGTVAYSAYLGGRIVHESPRLAAPPAGGNLTP